MPLLILILLMIPLRLTFKDDAPIGDTAPAAYYSQSMAQGQYRQALYHVEARASDEGWSPEAHRQAGDALYAAADPQSALSHWEAARAAMSAPDSALLRSLAGVYINMQRWPEAASALEDILRAQDDAWASFQLGLILAPSNARAAENHLRRAARDPVYAPLAGAVVNVLAGSAADEPVAMRVGLLYFSENQWPLAEYAFEYAFLAGYAGPEALAYSGLARVYQGKDGAAWIQAAVTQSPQNAHVRYVEALYRRAHNDYAASLDAMIQAAALDPNNPAFLAELGTAYRLMGQMEEAETWLRNAVSASQNAPDFQRLLALFYAEEGYNVGGRGQEALSQASAALPNDPDIRASYGWALYGIGQRERGLIEIEAALEIAPENARALYYRALVALEEGERERAVRLLERVAVSISPFASEAVSALQALEESP